MLLAGVIGNDGRIRNLDVVGDGYAAAADPTLANTAAFAVQQWQFLPTKLDGQPVETRINVNGHVRAAASGSAPAASAGGSVAGFPAPALTCPRFRSTSIGL